MLVPDHVRERHPSRVAAYLEAPKPLRLDTGMELFGRRRDGRLFPVEIGLNPIETPDGLQVLASVLDITVRRRDELELREKTSELERSNRELDQFASVVSHDLKSPLRGIASLAEWIAADYADVLDEEGRRQLDLLRARTTRMHRMIEGILEYSRAARGSDRRREVDTGALVRSVVELIVPPPNITVRIEAPLPHCFCNETQLAQVFQNLIGNAIQHLGKPIGVVIVGGRAQDDRAQFWVSDDGVGIAPEHHSRIFRIFQTLQIDPKERSTGIGLSIVQKIIQFNGGELVVESAPDRGTTFRFSMPGVS
jgi:signal transduction histidine kinase